MLHLVGCFYVHFYPCYINNILSYSLLTNQQLRYYEELAKMAF